MLVLEKQSTAVGRPSESMRQAQENDRSSEVYWWRASKACCFRKKYLSAVGGLLSAALPFKKIPAVRGLSAAASLESRPVGLLLI